MPVWINSPLTGDQVPLSFTVNVGWELGSFATNVMLAVTVTGGGTVSPSGPVPVSGTDMNFTVTFGAPTDDVTITATLTTDSGPESDSEVVNVGAPIIQTGGGLGPGPVPVPLRGEAKGAGDRAPKQLILAGTYTSAVKAVEVGIYAFGKKDATHGHTPSSGVTPELTLPAQMLNGIWVVALPPKYAAPHPQKNHHYQARVTAKGGISGGALATTCAAIPNAAIVTDLPSG